MINTLLLKMNAIKVISLPSYQNKNKKVELKIQIYIFDNYTKRDLRSLKQPNELKFQTAIKTEQYFYKFFIKHEIHSEISKD